jgi:hypothetical protein
MSEEFPSNSHAGREERRSRKSEKDEPRKKEIQRVTKGQAIQRKKPLYKRFKETFTGDDQVGVFEYVMLDVLIPGIKDIVADVATTAIETSLFGGDVRPRSRRRHGRGGGGYTSYNRMSDRRDSGRRDRDRDDDRRDRRRDRGHEQREYIVPTRHEADDVLDTMIECLSKYDSVSKRDLLSMIGEPHNFTDEDWGWTDLRGARVHRIGRDGYLIDLPRPEPLD